MGCFNSRGTSVQPTLSSDAVELINKKLPKKFCTDYEILRNPSSPAESQDPWILGHGSFSVVYKCRHKESGSLRAAKYVHMKKLLGLQSNAQAILDEIRRGASVLQSLRHEAIIEFHDLYESNDALCVILELGEGGELYEHIVAEKRMNEYKTATIIRQITSGVAYLHEHSVVHRDLKPENIVACMVDTPIGSKYRWKMIDFGFSRFTDHAKRMKSFVGTANYGAPEILLMQPYTNSVDIWSIGVITFLLLSGYLPFEVEEANPDRGQYELRFDPKAWNSISIAAKSFVMACLQINPDSRPSAENLLKMSFLDLGMHQKRFESLRNRKSPNLEADVVKVAE